MDFFIYDNVPRTDGRTTNGRGEMGPPAPRPPVPSFFNSIVGFEATDAATAVVDGTRLESSFKIGVTREDSKLWGAVLTFYPLRKITE